MKKFNLLLATTAMLSMGAMIADATQPDSTTVDVKAEVIEARSLNSTPLDFGRIVVSNAEELGVRIDASGIETITADTAADAAYILEPGEKGVVTGANCNQVNYPNNITLTGPTGSYMPTVSTIGCVDDQSGSATFFGFLYISPDTAQGYDYIPAGKYSGGLTVTAIYPAD